MIFDEVVLTNVGVYRGRQRIVLSPKSAKRRVVLVGALNGSGKTTLLDSMQLALYGRAGVYASRSSSSYDEFLRQLINKSAPADEGASIDLHFRHAHEGVEHAYQIHRSWSMNGDRVRERFDVIRDGRRDAVLIDHWDEYVEELLPARIAPLFFFDGEKIEQFADSQNAPELLKTAVQSLLGIDIVQRLSVDLLALQRRKRVELATEEFRTELDAAHEGLAAIERRVQVAYDNKAAANTELARAEKRRSELELAYRDAGGESFSQREKLRTEFSHYTQECDAILRRLRTLASGALPLLLVRDRMNTLATEDSVAQEASRAKSIAGLVESRDSWFVELLNQRKVKKKTVDHIQDALEKDRRSLLSIGSKATRAPLSDEARGLLTDLRSRLFDELDKETSVELSRLEACSERLTEIERRLAAVPDEEQIQKVSNSLSEAEARTRALQHNVQIAEAEGKLLEGEMMAKQRSIAQLLEKRVEAHYEASDAARIVAHADRARSALATFEREVVAHHIRRLEDLVARSLKSLLRKEQLVSKVEIHPETFQLVLMDEEAQRIPPEMLSAGERQLLAVSLLWALAQASGRPIPTVIDTPLGRLDSRHRANLVERYFPNASHQVILLSTDEEIDLEHYKKLEPSISHSYTLDFDDKQRGTSVSDGYLFAGV